MKSVNRTDMPLRNKKRHPLLLFLVVCSVTFFLSDANLFERFTPRAVCMYYNQKLIWLHGISDFIIFVAYVIISAILYILYGFLRKRGFPFSQYAYWFAGFIFFCSLTHLMGVLNLKITFYWLDGILKLLTAWFSILVCIALMREYPNLKEIKTPEEIAAMTNKLNELITEIHALREGKG